MLTLDNLKSTMYELATRGESPEITAASFGFELDDEAMDFFIGLGRSFGLSDPVALPIGVVLGFATAVRAIEERADMGIAAA